MKMGIANKCLPACCYFYNYAACHMPYYTTYLFIYDVLRSCILQLSRIYQIFISQPCFFTGSVIEAKGFLDENPDSELSFISINYLVLILHIQLLSYDENVRLQCATGKGILAGTGLLLLCRNRINILKVKAGRNGRILNRI